MCLCIWGRYPNVHVFGCVSVLMFVVDTTHFPHEEETVLALFLQTQPKHTISIPVWGFPRFSLSSLSRDVFVIGKLQETKRQGETFMKTQRDVTRTGETPSTIWSASPPTHLRNKKRTKRSVGVQHPTNTM